MRIKSIYIDGLHNAANKTYDFGDINYIFGNNGIGKSTILQAIQLALLGYIPGTAKNSKEALLRHSPKGKIEVTISLTDTENDSDIIVNRRITAKTTEVNIIPGDVNISDIIQNIELPIFNFNEFVGQTANKLKEYFIKNILPTVDGSLDWEKILTESIEDCNFKDKDAVIEYGMDLVSELQGSTLDQVIAANAKFKEEQSFNRSEVQRLQNTIDSLIYYDDYSGPTDINEINSQLLVATSTRDQLIKYESAAAATKTAKEELDRLNSEIDSLGGQVSYDKLVAQLSELKQKSTGLSSSINTRTTALASMRATESAEDSIIQSKGVCPYTKAVCHSIVAKIDDLRNESVTRKANSLELSKEIDKLNEDLQITQIEIRKCESVISDFNNTWNRIVTLEKTMGELPQRPLTVKTVFELDQEIANLTKNKEKLQANIQYNATIKDLTKMKYDAELSGKALAAWVKKTDTNGLQTTLMVAPFNDLAARITAYIGQMYNDNELKAHFVVSSKSNSFSFGLIRNEVYIPYDLLSSGEKCLYTLALMICITNTSKSPLKLLLCDDMFDHLDADAIESTFATLKKLKGIQFIFAGVKECQNAEDILIKV